jgi:hypothetical protein
MLQQHEMRPLQERLACEYSTFSIDWPGFGDEANIAHCLDFQLVDKDR